MNPRTLTLLKYVAYAVGAALAIYFLLAIAKKVRAQLEAGVDGIGVAIGNVFNNFSPLGLISDLGSDIGKVRDAVTDRVVDTFNPGSHDEALGDHLDTELEQLNTNEYAPGGRIYNRILSERGRAAADDAWRQVQSRI